MRPKVLLWFESWLNSTPQGRLFLAQHRLGRGDFLLSNGYWSYVLRA